MFEDGKEQDTRATRSHCATAGTIKRYGSPQCPNVALEQEPEDPDLNSSALLRVLGQAVLPASRHEPRPLLRMKKRPLRSLVVFVGALVGIKETLAQETLQRGDFSIRYSSGVLLSPLRTAKRSLRTRSEFEESHDQVCPIVQTRQHASKAARPSFVALFSRIDGKGLRFRYKEFHDLIIFGFQRSEFAKSRSIGRARDDDAASLFVGLLATFNGKGDSLLKPITRSRTISWMFEARN